MAIFSKILGKLRNTRYRYLFTYSNVRIDRECVDMIGKHVTMSHSRIIARRGVLKIADDCEIVNSTIDIKNGHFEIGPHTMVKDCYIEITDGNIVVLHHSKIQCRHLWVRFGGTLKIGAYTNVNRGSEIRADQSVEIGSYCQISYNINIWDTNTHSILPPNERKRIAEQYFPKFGHEEQRPSTKPVKIGDYCWIGEYCSIMKGTTLGNNVIVGYHTMLLNKQVDDNKTVVQNNDIRVL